MQEYWASDKDLPVKTHFAMLDPVIFIHVEYTWYCTRGPSEPERGKGAKCTVLQAGEKSFPLYFCFFCPQNS